jgi:hypothetical protein
VDNSQERTRDRSSAPPVGSTSPESHGVAKSSAENALNRRSSLSVAELAALCASDNSTPVFQQNAVRTLRKELHADAVLIIDYTDAFGTRVIRAVSGADSAIIGSEIWLPDWLTPANVDSPAKLTDIDPAVLSKVFTFAPGVEYQSVLAVAVPGITGASGMIAALAESPIEFDDSRIEAAQTIASLLSLSAARSNAFAIVQRDEAQLVAAHHITRAGSDGPVDHASLLENIAAQLVQFFEFDVIAHRVEVDGEFVTRGLLPVGQDHSYTIPSSGADSIESRAKVLRVAVSDTTSGTEPSAPSDRNPAWKSAGIGSTMAIPVNGQATQLLVLGSTRTGEYTTSATATANRLAPALTVAFASGNIANFETVAEDGTRPGSSGYLKSIASATDLISACGVIATQLTNRTGASRIQVGFIDEESGRAQLSFDTQPSRVSSILSGSIQMKWSISPGLTRTPTQTRSRDIAV